jgi:hypothetical protein
MSLIFSVGLKWVEFKWYFKVVLYNALVILVKVWLRSVLFVYNIKVKMSRSIAQLVAIKDIIVEFEFTPWNW